MTADSELPLVSIVTPSLNQAEFLEDTILSVLNQDYPNLEYLVLDGGSTDGSVEIIRKHEGRLAHWASRPDGGQAGAINRGWQLARGEILAYLNSDDLYFPWAVSTAARFFRDRPDVGIAYGACELFEQRGIVTTVIPPEFSLSGLLLGNFIAQPAAFLRRAALERVGSMDTSLRYAMDYDLWVRAAIGGVRIARVPGPALARFRIWRGSKTSTGSEGGLHERLLILERAFAGGRLSPEITGLRKYAKARACMAAAYGEFLNEDKRSVLAFLRRGVAYSPRVIRDPQFLMLCGSVVLGARISRALRHANWRAKHRVLGRGGPAAGNAVDACPIGREASPS